jgi:putative oxidoreductase
LQAAASADAQSKMASFNLSSPICASALDFAIQLLGGLLLLSGYFVPLPLTLLAAEHYDILAFHLTLSPTTIAPALVASVPWVLVFGEFN